MNELTRRTINTGLIAIAEECNTHPYCDQCPLYIGDEHSPHDCALVFIYQSPYIDKSGAIKFMESEDEE